MTKTIPLSQGEAAKEPWQMTREELGKLAKSEEPMLRRWRNLQKQGRGAQRGGAFVNIPRSLQPWTDAWSRHEGIVMKALSEGKPVPPEVLADYPDLARMYAPDAAFAVLAEEQEKEAV